MHCSRIPGTLYNLLHLLPATEHDDVMPVCVRNIIPALAQLWGELRHFLYLNYKPGHGVHLNERSKE